MLHVVCHLLETLVMTLFSLYNNRKKKEQTTLITSFPSKPVVFPGHPFSMLMLAPVPVLAVSILPEPGTLTDSCVVLAQLQPCGLLMQLISHDAPRPSRGLLRLCSSSICMSMLMRRKSAQVS